MKVIINADGKSCITVNPLGPEEPIESEYVDHSLNDGTDLDMCLYQDQVVEYNIAVNQWQKAESERQTFEIDIVDAVKEINKKVEETGKGYKIVLKGGYESGMICEADIVNGKAVIK